MIKMNNNMQLEIPPNIKFILEKMKENGFEAYIVGGCVRDLILNLTPKDWDITTNALPDQVRELFEHTVYDNNFGTVGVVFDEETDLTLKLVEITTYRKEGNYLDGRRPESVDFAKTLGEDLERRDFTINAIAYDAVTQELVDEHEGIKDLMKGEIRTVGNPDERFAEDGLRILRAVRIATQLDGEIENGTKKSIIKLGKSIDRVAIERIRDELVKLLNCDSPAKGILLLEEVGLLQYILPELRKGIGVDQNQAHKYDVFEHNIRTLRHAGVKELSLKLRLAALLHDVGKPDTREWSKEKKDYTFYNHEVVGSKMVRAIMNRLKFSKEEIDTVSLFVRWHMFFSDVDIVTLSGVRRMVVRVGEDKIWDLIDLRICDRIGTGRPKEQPYRLRKYKALIEEVLRDPISPKLLKVNGDILIKELKEKPGPKIGHLLHILLAKVLDKEVENTKEDLLMKSKELLKLDEKKLREMGEKSKIKRFEMDDDEIKKIRESNFVE